MFDLRSALRHGVIIGLAVASSLTTAWAMDRIDGRAGAQAQAAIARADDGHYWTLAMVDGRPVRMLVDTGASVVALTRQDAAALGLNPAADQFTVTVQTAAGAARAAPVQLAQIAVGDARVERVTALVVEDGLPHSLLGMSYLGRLNGFQAGPDGLTLTS